MEAIKAFEGIEYLHIDNAKNHESFNVLSSSLKYISIVGTKKDFDLSQIKVLKKVKSLWLNTIKSELDCEIFTHLPDLEELNILNSRKVVNIEKLLNCEKLRSVYFLDCNNPFKQTKSMFHSENYDRFDIKYS
jgi:hypothetical protein